MTQPVLSVLGPRPGCEAVEAAKQAVILIDRRLAVESAAQDLPVTKQEELREGAEREKLPYMAVSQLETLHESVQAETPSSSSSSSAAVELEEALSELAATKKADQFDWSGRALQSLPRSLTSLSFLASLNLANNLLEALPSAIGGLVNVVVLSVQSNHLKSLPDSIGNLSKLTILNVSGNQLRALPESLGKCSKLSELNANFNQLESWPPVLGYKLKNLRKLELHFNNLVGLPESVGHMKALQTLNLRNNRLRSLPSSIGMLAHLETLDVSRNFNNLCSLPESLGDLASLSVLDLSFNQIRELPASLGKIQRLKRLSLDQNPLVVPPKRVVEHSQEAVLEYLLELTLNGPATKKMSPPRRAQQACLMIPASPRHEYAGGWMPVRPGNSTWKRSFLAQFMCGGLVLGPAKTMRWQGFHSDDEDR